MLKECEKTTVYESIELLTRHKTQSELDEESKAKQKKINDLMLLAEKVHTNVAVWQILTIKA